MDRIMLGLMAFATFFFLAGCRADPGFVVLVEKGVPLAAVVLPEDPLPVEEFAAKELVYHLEKATGAVLSVYREGEITSDYNYFVYIGNCNATKDAGIAVESMAPSGYVVKTVGNSLFLAGKDRERSFSSHHHHWTADWKGTLHAVYHILENQMGVRWLWPGELGEHIPSGTGIVIAPLDHKGEPRFRQAWLGQAGLSYSHIPGWSSPEAKERYYQAQRLFMIRHRFGSVENMAYGHAFANYWRRFGETNPEFFARLPDGTRRPLEGMPAGNQISMCVSSPGFRKQVVSDWSRSPERNPQNPTHRPYLSACENDTPAMCTCEGCRSWDAPHPEFETHEYWGKGFIPPRSSDRWELFGEGRAPSLSDRYARFYAEILKEARGVDPDARVAGYAYVNYYDPPVDDSIDLDGVLILHVPPMGDRGLWFPYTEDNSSAFRKNWKGWSRLGPEMIFRPNLTHAGANLPVFYARRLAADFSYAAENGMVGTAFDSLLGAWSAQGPTLYTLARVHQHPEWTADKILDEYYAAFGPAEEEVREYFAYWERHADSIDPADVRRYEREERGGGFQDYVRISHRIFPEKSFKEAGVLLEAARRRAEGDDLAVRRVEYLEQGFTDARLTASARGAQAAAEREDTEENRKAFESAFERLLAYRGYIEQRGEHAVNLGYFAFREQSGAGWPHMPRPSEAQLSREREFQARWGEKDLISFAERNLFLLQTMRLSSSGWRFREDSYRRGDLEGWHRPEFDTDDWKIVETGKVWESFLGAPYVGAGWYRLELTAPDNLDGRAVYLRFDGVDESCWLWVNGEYAGRHHIGPEGWNAVFRLEITPYLQEGKNLLAVRVMNTAFAGGIYRPVSMEIYEEKNE